MPKVTSSRAGKKAGDFPLTEHPNGQYAKKRLGKVFYFGKVSNGKEAALREYRATWDYILEHGVKPSVQVSEPTPKPDAEPEQLTVKQLVNSFLASKLAMVPKEISPRTWTDYKQTCERLIKSFGASRPVADLGPADFQKLRTSLARDRGPVALGNEIQRVRTVFKYGYEDGHMPKPMLFGQNFRKPKKKVMRETRNASRLSNGKRMLTAAEIRTAYNAASMPLKLMILLAINGGLGQSDLSSLKIAHLDPDGGWLDYPRPKTGIDRPPRPSCLKTPACSSSRSTAVAGRKSLT
jgi:integrase